MKWWYVPLVLPGLLRLYIGWTGTQDAPGWAWPFGSSWPGKGHHPFKNRIKQGDS